MATVLPGQSHSGNIREGRSLTVSVPTGGSAYLSIYRGTSLLADGPIGPGIVSYGPFNVDTQFRAVVDPGSQRIVVTEQDGVIDLAGFGAAIGALAPPVLAANANNYTPTGASDSNLWILSSSSAIDITGIAGSTLNRLLTLYNGGANNIFLRDGSASSVAANRFAFSVTNGQGAGTDQVLPPGWAVTLRGRGSTGWVSAHTGSMFSVDATVGDVLLCKFTGPNFLTFDGDTVQGGVAGNTQQVLIGNGDVVNQTNFPNGNATLQLNNTSNTSAGAYASIASSAGLAIVFIQTHSPSAGGDSYIAMAGTKCRIGYGVGGAAPGGGESYDLNNNHTLKFQASATGDTNGFLYIPKVAGAPTGVPASLTGEFANSLPIVYDTTNHKLWVYDGAWKGIALS